MRWFYYLVFVVVLVSLAYSQDVLTVTLEYPEDEVINATSDDIILGCSGVGENSLVSMTLYSNITSSNGEFIAVETKEYTNPGEVVKFSFNNVDNDTYTWNCLLIDSEGNEEFAKFNNTLTVNFAKVWFSGNIPGLSMGEDTNLTNAIDLSEYFSNVDYYTFSGNNHISIIMSGSNVNFYPENDWNGTDTIIFIGVETISGVSSSVDSNPVDIVVVGMNDAPVFTTNISNKTMYKNGNKTLDLSNYFSDVDNILNYSYSILTHFSVEIDGDEIIFTPKQDWMGYEDIILTASDGNYSVSSNKFRLTVFDVGNHAPEIISFYPLNIESVYSGESQLFNLSYYDEDEDNITISWYLNDILVGTNSYYEFSNIEEGDYKLLAEISDEITTSSVSWNFNVIFGVGDGGIDTNQMGVCGNGIVDTGENCDNCKEDVMCSEDEICKNGRCVSTKKIPFLTAFILLLVLGGIYFIFVKYEKYKSSRKFMKKIKKIKGGLSEEKNEEELEKYIKSTLKKGFSLKEIEENLLKSGWKKEDIKKALIDLKKGKSSKKNIKPIKNYIKKLLKEGFDSNKIKETLLKGGWGIEDIKKAFDELK